MSAALRSYLEFRVTYNHKKRLDAAYAENKDLPPEEISRILQEQEVEDIKQLVPTDKRIDFRSWEGKEVLRQSKTRVNQRFFRDLILKNYQSQCCLTGIAVPDLLIASHIVPWADDPKNRLNPCNGLCLNALHDKAFDRGLISFDDDCRLLLSDQITGHFDNETVNTNFAGFEGQQLTPPAQHAPNLKFLARHRESWGF
ncbi:MAG: HNH endonuclease [Candidatus Pacebacteria bacterium]|nr:HNH endonuclease [Candidatus Paceibacterota bacterium]